MKLAFDAKRLFNNFTGLGNYSRFVVDALATSYPDNEYILYTPRVRRHPEVDHYTASRDFVVRKPTSAVSRALPSIWRSWMLGDVAAADGAHILHGLSNELPVTKPSGLKTVLTVHDLIFRRFPSYYNAIDARIYTWKLKSSIRKADRVIAVSRQTAADIRDFEKISDDRLVVVHQGCHSAFKQVYPEVEIDRIKHKYGLPDNFVLCVGTVERRKNAALIIEALSRMTEKVPLVIAGKPTAYATELQELARSKRLESLVQFIYHVPFTELPILYQAASVFVYPSVFEGFGIPIVEAIACRVPVITSTGSCFSEAGGPDCLYVDPSDPEELAVAISQALNDTGLRRNMVSKSLEYIRRFEPGVIAGEIMKVYKEL